MTRASHIHTAKGGLRYGSVCSGIEGASVAWHPLGFQPVFFSEIEPFPCEVLAHHYGSNLPGEVPATNGVPNYGDMTKFKDWPDATLDVLVGGTPCQAFSVAGLRKGLDDPRGNLTLTYLAVVDRYRPTWVVWENVPGVLSSFTGPEPESDLDIGEGWEATETSDFACFLGGLSELGYGWSYRVLDAQFVRVDDHARAVPQRRRRVFVVGHSSGDFRRAAAVLFEPESMRGDSPPSRKSGETTTHDVAASLVSSGRGVERAGETRGQDAVVAVHCADVAPTLNAAFGDKQGLEDQHINGGGDCLLPPAAMCLNAGAMGRSDAESETLIPVNRCVFDDAFAPSVAASLTRGAESSGKGGYAGRQQEDDVNLVAHALRGEGFDASEDGSGRGTPIVAVTVECADTLGVGANQTTGFESECVGVAFAIQERAVSENPAAGPDGMGVQADIAYTLEARQQVQGVAFDMRGRDGGAQFEGPHETANIRAADGGSSRSYVAEQWAVRRLTPLECERLQAFPDGYTDILRNGKPAADGPRYKALGNSMACNVMRWIGQRIQIAHDLFSGAAA